MLEESPPAAPTAGPPSLAPASPTQPIRRRPAEDEDEAPREQRGRRERGATATGPLPTPARRPARGKSAAKGSASEEDAGQVVEDAAGWRKVRRGLGWVQFGLFLAMLAAVGNFAVAAYCMYDPSRIPSSFVTSNLRLPGATKDLDTLSKPGYIGKFNLNLWKELEVLYLFALPVLAYLVLLVGRAGCMRVPESAKARGLAGGTFFLTWLAFGSFATYSASFLMPIFDVGSLPRETRPAAWTAMIYLGLLAEAWYVLFLGQAGMALHSKRVLREIALSVLLLVVIIAGVLIADSFYPLLMTSSKVNEDHAVETYVIQCGVYLVIAVIFVFRLISITGVVRRAIKRWMEDHKDELEAVTE
jgi:hypothetical protein